MLMMLASTLFLCHAVRIRRTERAVQVDRLEVNTYEWTAGCKALQVIVWEWNQFDHRYTATRFFFLGDERSDSLPFRASTGKWRFVSRSPFDGSKSVVFESEEILATVTDYDVWEAEMIKQGQVAI